jgi:uncharacterized YigZ family protein
MPYNTVQGLAVAELEVKKSRFISQVTHVTTEEEAIEFRHGIREQIPDASHYVSAYILHENNYMHFSDAKEPSGTAGMPVLNVIQHLELQDVVCVVARIFGGTLLGRGGLVRAYSKSAKLAFEKAHIVLMAPCRDILVSIAYSHYEQLMHYLESSGIEVLDTSFADDVTLHIRVLSKEADSVCAKISDMCNGRAELMVGEEMFDMVDAAQRQDDAPLGDGE